MNIIQIQNDLKNVSDQSLINYVQNPSAQVPSFLALGELNRRKEMRADYAKNNPPKSTVAQDLEQSSAPQGLAMLAKTPIEHSAPTSQGVADLPTGDMFNEKNFATGGIVAFTDNQDQPVSADMPSSGVATSRIQDWWNNLQAENLKREQQMKLKNKLISEQANLNWDIFSKLTPEQKQAQVDRAKQIGATLGTPDLSTPSNIPGANVLGSQAAADASNPFSMANLNPPTINQTALDQANQPPMVKETNPFDNFKAPQVPVEKVGDLANYADEFKRYIGEDPSRAALQERLSKMDTSAAEEERVAPWMALAQAGFGMAAGKSPYALTNIGEGALAGIKSYGDAKDKLDKLEEKHFDLSNDLAKSQRAETIAEAKYGADSKQAAENRAQTANIHNQAINTQLQIAKINASVTGATKLVSERLAAEAKATARFQLLYGKDAAIAGDPTLQSKYNQILMEEYKNAGIPLSSTSGVNSPANDLSKWTVKPK